LAVLREREDAERLREEEERLREGVRRVLAVFRALVLLRAGAFRRVLALGEAPSCIAFSSCLPRS